MKVFLEVFVKIKVDNIMMIMMVRLLGIGVVGLFFFNMLVEIFIFVELGIFLF